MDAIRRALREKPRTRPGSQYFEGSRQGAVQDIERGELALLPDENLLAELASYSLERLPAGGYRYSAPPGLHGPSDPASPPGRATCRLVFAVGDYLVAHHGVAFFPEITVVFAAEPGEHYHVPLLLAPYGYSVYRGS